MAKLTGLAHIGIFVKDAEISKDFYMNTLNFELKADIDNGGTRLIFLDAGSCQLELICPPGGAAAREAGVVDHICIECDNIKEWYDDLKAKNANFVTELSYLPNLLGGCANFFITGPDGERLEIWEYTSK